MKYDMESKSKWETSIFFRYFPHLLKIFLTPMASISANLWVLATGFNPKNLGSNFKTWVFLHDRLELLCHNLFTLSTATLSEMGRYSNIRIKQYSFSCGTDSSFDGTVCVIFMLYKVDSISLVDTENKKKMNLKKLNKIFAKLNK